MRSYNCKFLLLNLKHKKVKGISQTPKMDDLRSKQVKNASSRKNISSRRGTSNEVSQGDWSFQSNSPAMISNNSRKLRSIDREKAVAAHRVGNTILFFMTNT